MNGMNGGRSAYVEKTVVRDGSAVNTKAVALQLQESSLPWAKGKSEKISSLYQDSFSSKTPSHVEEGNHDLRETREVS
jgi:hypothetical protein